MNSIILSHDSALAFWSGPLSQSPTTPLDAAEANEAILLANKSVHAPALKTLRSLPLSSFLPTPLDVLVPRKSDHRTTKLARYHCVQAKLPDGAFSEIDVQHFYVSGEMHRVLVSSPELCFVQMANLVSDWELIELGYELCGDYAVDMPASLGFVRRRAVTTPAALSAFVELADGLPGIQRARRVVKWISGGSCCPQVSRLAMITHLSRTKGGFGFEKPLLNHKLDVPDRVLPVLGGRECRPSLYLPNMATVLEYVGAQRECDAETSARVNNAYYILGLNVMEFTDDYLADLPTLEVLFDVANAQSRKPFYRRPASNRQLQARHDLHEFLFHSGRRPRAHYMPSASTA